MFVLFRYMSGANPYIAFNKKSANRIIKRWRKVNVEVRGIGENCYLVDDREYERKHGNYWN